MRVVNLFLLVASSAVLVASVAGAPAPPSTWRTFVPYGDKINTPAYVSPISNTACTAVSDSQNYCILYCFDATSGQQSFSVNLGGYPIPAGPYITMTADNRIMVAFPTKLFAINASNGEKLWSQPTPVESTIAVIDASMEGGEVAYIGHANDNLWAVAANGTVVWQKQGSFPLCDFFKTPMYAASSGTLFVCGDTPVGGEPTVFAFDVPTGSMLWFDFERVEDPSGIWTDGTRFLYQKMNASQYIHCYMVDARSGNPIWTYATGHQHADTKVAHNDTVVVVGTWVDTTAITLADATKLWNIPNPLPGDDMMSHPVPVSTGGLALLHLQLEGNHSWELRRVDPMQGTVLWHSDLNVNGAEQWYFLPASSASSSSDHLLMRSQHTVFAWDFATGNMTWSYTMSGEADFTSFSGNVMINSVQQMVFEGFSIVPPGTSSPSSPSN